MTADVIRSALERICHKLWADDPYPATAPQLTVECPHPVRTAPKITFVLGPHWENWPVLHCVFCEKCATVLME